MSTIETHSKTNALLPELRFPEFYGEWQKKLVNDISSKLKVGFVGTCEPFYTSKEEGVLLVRTGNLKGVRIELNEEKYVNNEFHEKNVKSQVYPGDLLLARHGGNGEICRVPDNFPTANCLNIVILRTSENVENKFFQLVYSSFAMQKQISAVTAGSTQVVINTKEIGKLKVTFPSLPEQQKIASFLGAVDEKIQQLSRKKALLEQYKKGVMQQIFSQEIRFKDESGNDYADWEEKNYGDIFSFYSTNSYSRDILNYEDGEVKNIHYGDIHTKFKTHFYIEKEYVPFINKDVDLNKIKPESYCEKGDLVIADASEDYDDIGKTIELANIGQQKLLAGLHTFLARPNKYQMHIGFSGFMVQTWKVRRQVMTIAQGTKVLGLATWRLAKVKLEIPCLEEQKKITELISAIEFEINQIDLMSEEMQDFKKGLLQKMFV